MNHNKRKQVYEALVDGATRGLTGEALFDFVRGGNRKISSKRIVRASLLALTDPDLDDPNILDVIYALAITHRMDELGIEDDHDEDDVTTTAPFLEPPEVRPSAAGTKRF